MSFESMPFTWYGAEKARNRANVQPKTLKVWRGDNVNGWAICFDTARVGRRVGLIVPRFANIPLSPQHRYLEGIPLDENDLPADDVLAFQAATGQARTPWERKGFRPASEAKGKQPSEKIAHYLIERFCNEQRANMEAKQYRPEDIEDRISKIRGAIYRANDLEPKLDAIDALLDVYAERGQIAGERGRTAKEHPDAADPDTRSAVDTASEILEKSKPVYGDLPSVKSEMASDDREERIDASRGRPKVPAKKKK